MVLALRRFASPTHLMRAGAFAGRASGGISAFVYALHCTDDLVAFVGIRYGLTIAFCTGIGACLGLVCCAGDIWWSTMQRTHQVIRRALRDPLRD